MLMRTTDPFRELDRLTQQVFGTAASPAFMPMDAWRDGDTFYIEFDLPGVRADSIDLDVERNVLTVRADRPSRDGNVELIAAERPSGVFSRQLILGDNVDLDNISASYHDGVLSLQVPVAEKAKPRKIAIEGLTDSARSRASCRPATAPDDREANGWAGAKRFVVGPLEVQFAELGIQASSLGAGPTADLRYHAETVRAPAPSRPSWCPPVSRLNRRRWG
jgi:HSP20 family protein